MFDLDKINAIANKLKKQREHKGLTLEQVNKQTRIHLNILRAFEEGNFSILSPAYVRSFLKRYAEYLGLPSQEILNEYTANYPQDAKQVIFLEKEKQKEKTLPKGIGRFAGPVVIFATSLIIVAFLTYGGIRFIGFIQSKFRHAHKTITMIPKTTSLKPAQEAEKIIVPKNAPIILTLKATGDSWLEVSVDGSVIFKGILKKGDKETWQATDSIEVLSGRPQNLMVELNQKPLGKFGRGIVRNMVVTKEGAKIKR